MIPTTSTTFLRPYDLSALQSAIIYDHDERESKVFDNEQYIERELQKLEEAKQDLDRGKRDLEQGKKHLEQKRLQLKNEFSLAPEISATKPGRGSEQGKEDEHRRA